MKWNIDIATNLTWGQIACLNSGLKELNDSERKEEPITEPVHMNKSNYNEEMIKRVIDAKRPDGTVDLGKVFSRRR